MLSVALGLWGGVFIMSLSNGVSIQRKQDVIYSYLSHVQIHHPDFMDERLLKHYLPDGADILAVVEQQPLVQAATARTLTYGMAASARNSGGVDIHGILPDKEQHLTNIDDKLVAGTYLEGDRHPIVIGQSLADKLGVGLRSKIVVTFQDTTNEIIAGAFRVSGIYQTVSPDFDEVNVYVRADDVADLMGLSGPVYQEIAMLAVDEDSVTTLKNNLQSLFPGPDIQEWKELSPELRFLDTAMDSFLYIFIAIILLALSFGLINTMLMSVLERTRELGMLMAIGMNKWRVFSMILMETLYLAIIGGIIGLGASWFSIKAMEDTGIRIDAVSEGMASFGMTSTLYPVLDIAYYPPLGAMILVFALLAALYPARKALQLKPAAAIRKI